MARTIILLLLLTVVGCQGGAAPTSIAPAAAPPKAADSGSAAASAPPSSAPASPVAPRQLRVGYAATNPRVTPLWLSRTDCASSLIFSFAPGAPSRWKSTS